MYSVSDCLIGFIGLGNMGKPMVQHLISAGAKVILYNRSMQVLEELAGKGAEVASSPREVAEKVENGIIFLSLPNANSVAAVVEGGNGLFAGLAVGSKVVDMGSTAVEPTREWYEKTNSLGSDWIDAPVSGGQKGALEASLAIMVGGNEESYKAVRPLLEILGSTVSYMGSSGAGQCTKLANQIIVASSIASLSEAFLLCKENGVDLKKARNALFFKSNVLDQHGQRMIEGNFELVARRRSAKDLLEAFKVINSV